MARRLLKGITKGASWWRTGTSVRGCGLSKTQETISDMTVGLDSRLHEDKNVMMMTMMGVGMAMMMTTFAK